MQPLYQTLEDTQVLDTVIKEISQTKQKLVLVEAEEDGSQVRPNQLYFETLRLLAQNGVKIFRWYFGSIESYELRRKNAPFIHWVYAGKLQNYQRAIIIDNQKAFLKIGRQFLLSEHKNMISLLKTYLQQCAAEEMKKRLRL